MRFGSTLPCISSLAEQEAVPGHRGGVQGQRCVLPALQRGDVMLSFYARGESDAMITCHNLLFKQCLLRCSCFCLLAEVEGLQVTVPEKKKVAMLFQPALLRCHFSTSSTQPAVVQWRYKSYCQDRMGEALGMATSGVQTMSKRNLDWDPYLDCVDSRRTVRVVASKQGSAVTIGDFYKERDVSIVHGNSPAPGMCDGGWN